MASFSLIMSINAALKTPRVNSGVSPWYNPDKPSRRHKSRTTSSTRVCCCTGDGGGGGGVGGDCVASPLGAEIVVVVVVVVFVVFVVLDVCNNTLARRNGNTRTVDTVRAIIPNANASTAERVLPRGRVRNTAALTCSYTVYCNAGFRHKSVYADKPE